MGIPYKIKTYKYDSILDKVYFWDSDSNQRFRPTPLCMYISNYLIIQIQMQLVYALVLKIKYTLIDYNFGLNISKTIKEKLKYI